MNFLENIFRVLYFGATHVVYFVSGIHAGIQLYSHPEWLLEMGWIALIALLCFALRVIGNVIFYCKSVTKSLRAEG